MEIFMQNMLIHQSFASGKINERHLNETVLNH